MQSFKKIQSNVNTSVNYVKLKHHVTLEKLESEEARACNNIRRHWLICTNFSGQEFFPTPPHWVTALYQISDLALVVLYHSVLHTYFYKEQKGGVQENGIIISFLENWDHFKYRDDSSLLVRFYPAYLK